MRLYEIESELQELLNRIDDGEDVEYIAPLLELNEAELAKKLEGYGKAILSYNAEMVAYSDEIKRLQGRKKTIDNRIVWLKNNAIGALVSRGIKKIQCGTIALSDRQTKAVEVHDLEALTDKFVTTKIAANKTAIKEAISAGTAVDGASIVVNHSLSVR